MPATTTPRAHHVVDVEDVVSGTFLLQLVVSLTGCVTATPPPKQLPAPIEEVSNSGSRCVRYAGPLRDPSLLGIDIPAPPRCCESGYGIDPRLVADSCSFARYLGESEELACVHRFADAAGDVHELRVTPVLGLELAAAIDLHESGEFDATHTAEWLPGRSDVWLSSSAARSWALVSGWSAPRRLSWDPRSCAVERMQPVLLAMADAAPDRAQLSALPRMLDVPAQVEEVPAASLLARSRAAERASTGPYPLPRGATQLIDAALLAAAHDEPTTLLALVRPDARWGLPDRRQLGARPIADDGGLALLDALRDTSARMPADARLHCPAIDRRAEPLVRRGDATMWCVWSSEDHLDLLVFALRGQIAGEHFDARIEYVGLFPSAPRLPLRVPGEPPPPPSGARAQLRCGDPHASAEVPGCPRDEPEEDDELTGAASDDDADDIDDAEGIDDSAAIDDVGPAGIEELFDQLDVPWVRDLDRQQHEARAEHLGGLAQRGLGLAGAGHHPAEQAREDAGDQPEHRTDQGREPHDVEREPGGEPE